MTQRSTPQFRVAPPTLEPGPVLLHQLAELSAASSPSVRTVRYAGVRALAGAATVAVIGGTTWVAGAAPGSVDLGPAERAIHESTGVPTPGEGVVWTPQPDDMTSVPGSSWSPELPGNETSERGTSRRTPATRSPKAPDRADEPGAPDDAGDKGKGKGGGRDDHGAPHDTGAPNEPGEQPPVDHPGNGTANGRGDGTGNGHGRGHAKGHDKVRHGGGKPADSPGRSGDHRKDADRGHNAPSKPPWKKKGRH